MGNRATLRVVRLGSMIRVEMQLATPAAKRLRLIEKELQRNYLDAAGDLSQNLSDTFKAFEKEQEWIEGHTDADVASMTMDEAIGFWDGDTVLGWDFSDYPGPLTSREFASLVKKKSSDLRTLIRDEDAKQGLLLADSDADKAVKLFGAACDAALKLDGKRARKIVADLAKVLGWKKRATHWGHGDSPGAFAIKSIWHGRRRWSR